MTIGINAILLFFLGLLFGALVGTWLTPFILYLVIKRSAGKAIKELKAWIKAND